MLAFGLGVAAVPVVAILSWHALNARVESLPDVLFPSLGTPVDSPFWFEKVRRSALNNGNIEFILANAPTNALNSFGARQQNIARLSLQSASTILIRRLRGQTLFWAGLRQTLRSCVLKLWNLILLAACNLGRVILAILHGLSTGVPNAFQIRASSTLLSKIGMLMLIADENHSSHIGLRGEPLSTSTEPSLPSAVDTAIQDLSRALCCSLPNDFSSLIFLATIRDNNTGSYIHPEIAKRFSDAIADEAMLACHRQIFERVVALSLEDLTDQLDAYMKTVAAPRRRLIESWTKVRAYRSTIPIDADPILSEIYFMKVEVAIAILEARLPNQIQ